MTDEKLSRFIFEIPESVAKKARRQAKKKHQTIKGYFSALIEKDLKESAGGV
jgi:hypothetical protein